MGRNVEHLREWAREHYRKNPLPQRARSKAWREANPERYRAMLKEWRAREGKSEKRRIYMAAYRKANLLPWIISYQRRRARIAGARLGATPKLSLYDFSNVCSYCGAFNASGLDHVEPLSRGGMHSPENTVPCCISCNQRKNNKPLLIFLLKKAA